MISQRPVAKALTGRRIYSRTASKERPRPTVWNVRAETSPKGFHTQSARRAHTPAEPPLVPAPAAPPPAATSGDAEATVRRQSRARKVGSPRTFVDPFAAGEEGSNYLRCGYLVEAARDRRGQLTCAARGWPDGAGTAVRVARARPSPDKNPGQHVQGFRPPAGPLAGRFLRAGGTLAGPEACPETASRTVATPSRF
jgi:hypothetical protein